MLEMLLVFVAGMTTLGCVTGILVAIIRRSGRRPTLGPEVTLRLDEIADRLSRLEPAIDAMSVEVERISEAQRVHREDSHTASRPGRRAPKIAGSTTPH